MDNKKFIEYFQSDVNEYLKNNYIINRTSTPIIYKISKIQSTPNLKDFLQKLTHGLDESSPHSIGNLKGLFELKEVLKYKIVYNGKEYKQDNYRSPIKWIHGFFVGAKIPYRILALSKPDKEGGLTFSKREKDVTSKGNVVPFLLDNEKIYFQHRHWGLGNLQKDLTNPNRKYEGDLKLRDKIKELSQYLCEQILFQPMYIEEKWEIGKHKIINYNESNNSNL